MHFFPYNPPCFTRVIVNVCYASVGIFILDVKYSNFQKKNFSPINCFPARVALRATSLHFVGAPIPRSPVF